MRVIALEKQPSSELGGQELNLFEICGAFAKRGHQVNLVYTEEGNLLEKYRSFSEHLVQIKRYGPARKRLPHLLQFSAELMTDINKVPTSPDSVIFCNDFSSVFFGSILSSLKRIPLIHYIQLPAYEFKFKWRPGLSAVDRFIAVSNQTKSSWVKLGIPDDKVSVVHNGIDTEKFKPPDDYILARRKLHLPETATLLSFVGRLNPNKGIQVLIKAFALAAQKHGNLFLLVAGNPVLEPSEDSPEARVEYKRSLEQLAIASGVGDRVKFLGHVPDTVTLYQASDITIVPSIWPDPCPRVVIESLACGTPVLASRIGGIPEQLSPTFQDWLVEPGDEFQLLDRLLQLENWRQRDPQLGDRCRQHVLDHFSPESMMDGIEKILLNTINPAYTSTPHSR